MANLLKGAGFKDVGSGAASDIYTAQAAVTASIISAVFSNKTSAEIKITVQTVRGGQTYVWVQNAPIPAGGALDVIENKPLVLMPGEKLQAQCSAASASDCTYSMLEQN